MKVVIDSATALITINKIVVHTVAHPWGTSNIYILILQEKNNSTGKNYSVIIPTTYILN